MTRSGAGGSGNTAGVRHEERCIACLAAHMLRLNNDEDSDLAAALFPRRGSPSPDPNEMLLRCCADTRSVCGSSVTVRLRPRALLLLKQVLLPAKQLSLSTYKLDKLFIRRKSRHPAADSNRRVQPTASLFGRCWSPRPRPHATRTTRCAPAVYLRTGSVRDLPRFTITPCGLDEWDSIWRRRDDLGVPAMVFPQWFRC